MKIKKIIFSIFIPVIILIAITGLFNRTEKQSVNLLNNVLVAAIVENKSFTIKYGQTYKDAYGGELPEPNAPCREFDRWTNAKSGGFTIKSDDTFEQTQSITLYAQWKVNHESITYTSLDSSAHKVSCNQCSDIIREREEHSWNLAGTKCTKCGYTKTVSNKISVTLNANEGKFSNGSETYNMEATKNVECTITKLPTRDGYTLLGWSESKNATTATYVKTSVTLSSDKVLYAVWQKNTSNGEIIYWKIFNVNYYENKNQDENVYKTQTKSKQALSHTFALISDKPTRSGYEFLGWSTDRNATFPEDYSNGITLSLSNNEYSVTKKLYAVWQKNNSTSSVETISVILRGNGGKFSNGTETYSITANKSKAFTVNDLPTRDNYTLLGWSTSSSATTADYAKSPLTLSSSKTLYAVWQNNSTPVNTLEFKTFTLTYDPNGGSGGPGTVPKTVAQDNYTFTISSTKPTRSGYEFVFWAGNSNTPYNADRNANGIYEAGESITIFGSKTLYAIWKPVSSVSGSEQDKEDIHVCKWGELEQISSNDETHSGKEYCVVEGCNKYQDIKNEKHAYTQYGSGYEGIPDSYVCSICGHTCGHSKKQEKSRSDATCISQGKITYKCEYCGGGVNEILRIDPNNHVGDIEWKFNDTSHWKECDKCEAVTQNKSQHDWSNSNGVCVECDYECKHKYDSVSDYYCNICKFYCAHYMSADGSQYYYKCDACRYSWGKV